MASPDLAAAKQHVLARHQVLKAKAQTLSEARSLSLASTTLHRLPSPLGGLEQQGVRIWNTIRGREGTHPDFRVGQVDAELLDEELLGLLRAQVGDGLKYLGVCSYSTFFPTL